MTNLMTTKQFRNMIREANIDTYLMMTNPRKKAEGTRNVGAWLKHNCDGSNELKRFVEVLEKHGFKAEDHDIRLYDNRGARYYGNVYIRAIAKIAE